jgi:hypothetical protein
LDDCLTDPFVQLRSIDIVLVVQEKESFENDCDAQAEDEEDQIHEIPATLKDLNHG